MPVFKILPEGQMFPVGSTLTVGREFTTLWLVPALLL
uniref:Uncharacterized protein n=1 Tax=Rhizophora mucronata TaxID=61149 RepID=A0A2P2NF79_RHIMU